MVFCPAGRTGPPVAGPEEIFMPIIKDNQRIRESILDFDRRIDRMHAEFGKYRAGEPGRMPDWQRLEREMLSLSRKKIPDLELAGQLDRVMHKFQNRKKIWFKWVEEYHTRSLKEDSTL
jgi:hypothetical protein